MRWRIDTTRSTGAKAKDVAVIELDIGELGRLLRSIGHDDCRVVDDMEVDLNAARLELARAARERAKR